MKKSRIHGIINFSHGIVNVFLLFIAEFKAQRLKPIRSLLSCFISWAIFLKLDLNIEI